jgi:G:T/U-mismatch repair DNA glycosylase
MTTEHQYLSVFPILPDSTKLIVGTIHPHDHESFPLKYYYGNMLSLWKILSDGFPGELSDPNRLDDILAFLRNRKISVSDTIVKCKRIKPTALDEHLTDITLHHDIVRQIKVSQINHILFTSGFGKNNAFRLFYDGILKEKITPDIKRAREVLLDPSFFGRPVKLTVLYSPSSSSNRSIPRTRLFKENKHLYENVEKPIWAFKVDHYRTNLM